MRLNIVHPSQRLGEQQITCRTDTFGEIIFNLQKLVSFKALFTAEPHQSTVLA